MTNRSLTTIHQIPNDQCKSVQGWGLRLRPQMNAGRRIVKIKNKASFSQAVNSWHDFTGPQCCFSVLVVDNACWRCRDRSCMHLPAGVIVARRCRPSQSGLFSHLIQGGGGTSWPRVMCSSKTLRMLTTLCYSAHSVCSSNNFSQEFSEISILHCFVQEEQQRHLTWVHSAGQRYLCLLKR